ncbi:MAG: glycosyltransferase family 2 protein [Hyphomicrobiaceae bacterium]|nr:glycosyltransferase family 2 protein [Hyphomicrobiaceae bacterium]
MNQFDEPSHWPKGREKWNAFVLYKIALYFGVLFMLLASFSNRIWDPQYKAFIYAIGLIAIWRVSWWALMVFRASYYQRVVFPKLRARAQKVWNRGWRPNHLHFMMTTYKEDGEITDYVVRSICAQVRELGCPATLWLGSGDGMDEKNVIHQLQKCTNDIDLTLKIVRQNQPGKRMAIGLVLRAMSRARISPADLVVFMDGDFILAPHSIKNCLTLFAADPKLQAVTTDEDVICRGPRWIASMLAMRFAQRRIAMSSHAVSGRVLTLTGRMSVFRARHVVTNEFIRLVEADYLKHWLWGNFRFLSGDDKSTWFYLLKKKARMLYVPDAMGYTVEIIEGNGLDRMVQNFRRWSGNMLRNGSRAIALGPRHMPFFIWWTLIDQRIAMWTTLIGPVLVLFITLLYDGTFFFSYLIYLAFTRMIFSLVLFHYARKIDLSFPLLLYFNQIINSIVKVYALFRLSKQRWSNRGNQKSGFTSGSRLDLYRNVMASYLTALHVTLLILLIALSTRLYAPGLMFFK